MVSVQGTVPVKVHVRDYRKSGTVQIDVLTGVIEVAAGTGGLAGASYTDITLTGTKASPSKLVQSPKQTKVPHSIFIARTTCDL